MVARFLMLQPVSEDDAEPNKKILPATLRIALNWTIELDHMLGNEKTNDAAKQSRSNRFQMLDRQCAAN